MNRRHPFCQSFKRPIAQVLTGHMGSSLVLSGAPIEVRRQTQTNFGFPYLPALAFEQPSFSSDKTLVNRDLFTDQYLAFNSAERSLFFRGARL